MKKLILLAVLTLNVISCKKDDTKPQATTQPQQTTGAEKYLFEYDYYVSYDNLVHHGSICTTSADFASLAQTGGYFNVRNYGKC